MLNCLVKSMDIPTSNTLAHLYVTVHTDAGTKSTEKRIRFSTKGLPAVHRALRTDTNYLNSIVFSFENPSHFPSGSAVARSEAEETIFRDEYQPNHVGSAK